MESINLTETQEPSIGQMVANDHRTAEIFRKYKIDFCCGGKKSLAQVCKNKNIDINQVRADLAALNDRHRDLQQNFLDWNIGALADYIVDTHHAYVKTAIPMLLEFTNKVARVHGDRHPEAIEASELFFAAAQELSSHMLKEEKVLFPYMKQLGDFVSGNEPVFAPFGTVKNPIAMMEHEHDTVGSIFEKIRQVTGDYNPPADACATFRVTYAKLKEFEEDLHQHIHLENNILFPKSIELEQKLQA